MYVHTYAKVHPSLTHRPKRMSVKAENGEVGLTWGSCEHHCVSSHSVCSVRGRCKHLVYFSPWICMVFLHSFIQDQSDSSTLVHNLTPARSKATLLEKSDPHSGITLSLTLKDWHLSLFSVCKCASVSCAVSS